jgi:hypothetical protein
MANGKGNGNGNGDGRQQHNRDSGGIGQRRPQRQWPMATAMGNSNGNGNGVGDDVGEGDGDRNCNGHGQGNGDKSRIASSCAGNVQHYGRSNTLPPPPWTQRKVIHQCCFMGVTLLRVFAPFQGGGFLTAHHGFFFCLLFIATVQFTEQPSVCPPHYSGAQEPCQPIDALPPPLL